ncbi:four helix bundle protein [Porphyromonadaceae bacterium NLAE-zl-C104]|jgi:four helix bundle protein|uniref:four helix bundle protein n=1 Tax=Proteiniphilum TaxID=294702 RepID=UPI00089470DE|nr:MULTISPECIES: four helix bundle protein [Proteiniphilum]MDY9918186.1 four helix bundle protein [Proteiniphilum sp.]SDZ82678.1 four helix bundle protein [Porphyromonadaceae bacterium KH3R12]SFS29953.1 four helix bundle protein [Porphyromonadaceae bacterium NLAE-zl-C104]
MSKIEQFEDLEVWKMARSFSKKIYLILEKESFSKDYRLRDQIRGSAGSIMDNIAEGFERSGNKEFVQFLFIAKGSCGEIRSQLYRALDIGYICEEEFEQLYQEALQISQSLSGFIKYLKTSELRGPKYK